jgi:hypothetical protein
LQFLDLQNTCNPGNWNASLLPCFAESLSMQVAELQNLQHQSKQDQTEHRCECEVSQKINSEFHSIPITQIIFLSLITTIRQKKTELGIGNQFLPSSRQECSGSGGK